jgi:hypothetical protein
MKRETIQVTPAYRSYAYLASLGRLELIAYTVQSLSSTFWPRMRPNVMCRWSYIQVTTTLSSLIGVQKVRPSVPTEKWQFIL